MTARIQPITRYQAPSYFEYAGRLHADGVVIYGPHLDVQDIEDPFQMARRFAHAMACEMGEPFAWGWYETAEGARPAVCAQELLPRRGFFTDGTTGAKVAG